MWLGNKVWWKRSRGLFILVLASCTSTGHLKGDRKLFKANMETVTHVTVDGEKICYSEAFSIYKSGNCFLMEFPRQYKRVTPNPVNCIMDSVFNERLIAISYNYFAFDITEKYGYTYLELNGSRLKMIYIDSLLSIWGLNARLLNKQLKRKGNGNLNKTQVGTAALCREPGNLPIKELEIRDFMKRWPHGAGQ